PGARLAPRRTRRRARPSPARRRPRSRAPPRSARRATTGALAGRWTAESPALHLARGVLGQLVDEADAARVLVGRDLALDELHQLAPQLHRRRVTDVADDVGHWVHEPVGVLLAHDRALPHRRMTDERLLDLRRRNPL